MRTSLFLVLVSSLSGGCLISREPLSAREEDASGIDAALRDANSDAFGDAGTPDASNPDAFSPDAPGLDAPDASVEPDAFLEPDAFSPDAYVIPDAFSPDAYVIPDAFVPDAFVSECIDGARRCAGNAVQRCEFGRWVVGESCSLGCGETTARVTGPHCLQLVPSNVSNALMVGTADYTAPVGASAFDTDDDCVPPAVVALDAIGREQCVLAVRNATIAVGSTLRVLGSRPLVVLATGDVTIDGRIVVDANRTRRGVGQAGDEGADNDSGGGGGGSYCGEGGNGGGRDGAPGAVNRPSLLSPLFGGSAGGDGSEGASDLRGVGGNGGGALQISVRGVLRVNGSIVAAGRGGQPGRTRGRSAAAGGGGGSGGAVLLEAGTIVYGPAGLVDLRGGGGGSGACYRGSAGTTGNRGQDALDVPAALRPAGGAIVTCDGTGTNYTSGAGGDGAGISQLRGRDGQDEANGGGGGGGAGCYAVRAVNHDALRIVTLPETPEIYQHAQPELD